MRGVPILLKNIEDELESVDLELATLPLGRLNKRRNIYYHSLDGKEYSISSNPELRTQLSRKKLLVARKKQLQKNHTLLSKLDTRSPLEVIDGLTSLYQGLDKESFYHPEVKKWMNETYRQNSYLPEQRKYASNSGRKFRTKSEVIIANLLERYGIPYRYDAVLVIGGQRLCPDFIIRNPYTNKEITLEHFGALHQPEYEEKMNRKMETYRKNGFTLLDDLIYTFESDIQDNEALEILIVEVILGDIKDMGMAI